MSHGGSGLSGAPHGRAQNAQVGVLASNLAFFSNSNFLGLLLFLGEVAL